MQLGIYFNEQLRKEFGIHSYDQLREDTIMKIFCEIPNPKKGVWKKRDKCYWHFEVKMKMGSK